MRAQKSNVVEAKNVLFLAPHYNYAKSVVNNQCKDLDRKGIPYKASVAAQNMYIHTEKAHIEIVYSDPVKWTVEMIAGRDAVFGKRELVNQAEKTFIAWHFNRPKESLSRYILEAHTPENPEFPPRDTYLPEITNVYFNDPATVVLWDDGTKTVVMCQKGDVYSKETGLALCVMKKALGNMPNFNNAFRKWIPEEATQDTSMTQVKNLTVDVEFNGKKFAERVDEAIKHITKAAKECISHG